MKKLTFVIAALATIAVAAPTIASAEEFGVRVGGDRDHGEMHRGGDRDRGGMRVEMRGDRHHDGDWRRHRAQSVVVVKHRHHHED